MSSSQHNTYTRADGVIGVGFQIEHSGRPQHSVAWPDRTGERFTADELARLKITVDGRHPAESAPQQPAGQVTGDEHADAAQPQQADEPADAEPPDTAPVTEAEAIRQYLSDRPSASNADVIAALAEQGIEVQSSQVSRQRKRLTGK